uniref:NADH-ubiquinone oxidoreductase chain 3 n=1 Tax=Therophilus festivus TaxID=1421599 RepID=A0A0A6ZKM9_9HYME|nr:NADH dehydrogenase subunit 3 [Therophilus festivus]
MILILMLLFILFLLISIILILLNYLISMNKFNYFDKLNSFECGFDMFISSRLPFSIMFYLISILFLIFDIEIVLLFPMINSKMFLNYLNWFISMFIIIIILFMGLEYEKNEGSLKWMK